MTCVQARIRDAGLQVTSPRWQSTRVVSAGVGSKVHLVGGVLSVSVRSPQDPHMEVPMVLEAHGWDAQIEAQGTTVWAGVPCVGLGVSLRGQAHLRRCALACSASDSPSQPPTMASVGVLSHLGGGQAKLVRE